MIISNHSMQSLRLLKLSCYLYCFCGCTHMSTTSCLHTNTVRDPSYNVSIENLLTCRLGHDLKPMWSFNFIRIFRVVLLFNYQGSVCYSFSSTVCAVLFSDASAKTILSYGETNVNNFLNNFLIFFKNIYNSNNALKNWAISTPPYLSMTHNYINIIPFATFCFNR